MAVSSYTENGLKLYMHAMLGDNEVAAALDWSVEDGDYDEALNEALLVYGTSDITAVTGNANIRKLRAIARMELWRNVMARTTHRHQRGIQGEARSEHMVWEHAKSMFMMASEYAARLGVDVDTTSEIGITKVTYDNDAYRLSSDTDNEWSRVN